MNVDPEGTLAAELPEEGGPAPKEFEEAFARPQGKGEKVAEPGAGHHDRSDPTIVARDPNKAPEESKAEPTRIESLYRRFQGKITERHSTLLSIIGMEFKRRVKRPIFILLIIFAWISTTLPYILLVYFARLYTPEDAFIYDLIEQEVTRDTYILAYTTSFYFAVLFAAFVGGKLLSQSFADRTIVLYLTKPVSRTDFLLTRFGVVALTISLVTLIPVVVLYFSMIAMTYKDLGWFVRNFWVFGSVVGFGILMVVTFSNISLAFSCTTKKVYWAMASVIVFLTLTEALSGIINEMTQSDYGILITVWANLEVLGHIFFQLDSPYDVNWLFSLFMIAFINCASFAYVFWKLAVMEIE